MKNLFKSVRIYYRTVLKDGYNPVNKEKVQTNRRELYTEYGLKLGEEYADWICQFVKGVHEC